MITESNGAAIIRQAPDNDIQETADAASDQKQKHGQQPKRKFHRRYYPRLGQLGQSPVRTGSLNAAATSDDPQHLEPKGPDTIDNGNTAGNDLYRDA